MIGIYYQKRGLVWISYPDKTMKVILRKGIYDEVDRGHKVVYSEKMEGIQDAVGDGRIKTSQVKSSPQPLGTIHSILLRDWISII